MIGTTLGHYRIESEAGSGGMGVVYRGTDINLKRPAAIKVLPTAAFADPERRRRFLQEAQAASALNHPDIVTIYEIGSEGATDFIAMELVVGRPLDAVIIGRPIPLPDALRIAMRIAGALGAAHRAGIVHRDLKPANVMLTDAGGVKLLDFGVAKLMEPSVLDTGLTAGPAQTRTGLIVGTLAYMSPEQARGETVDARSDIYAFGVLFHEMLTGKRPGVEGSRVEALPRDVRRIVARCLEPERDRRFQNIDDVRLALEDADIRPAADSPQQPARSSRTLLAVAASVALAAIAVAGWLLWRGGGAAPVEPTTTLTRLTMDSGLTIDPALSPDGKFIAFASDRSGDGNLDVWVRQVAGGEPVRLTSDPADDREPTFSPDGSRVAFRSDRDGGGVYVTSTFGGDARRVADQCRRPRWSPSGAQILCWVGLNTGYLISKADAPRVFVVDAAGGGEARRLLASFAVASAPAWSTDGRHLIFLGRREMNDAPDWWIANADGSSPQPSGALKTIDDARLAPGIDSVLTPDVWMADGRVLFSARRGDSTNIWSLRLDANGRAEGRPRRMTAGTEIELNPTADAAGALAFAAISNDVDLWKRTLDAAGLAAGVPERLTHDPATDLYPAFSPDGTRLAFASNRSGTFDVWLRDMASRKEVDIAPRIGFPSLPLLTKDGLRVVFQSSTPNRWNSIPLPGAVGARTAAPQVVCDPCDPLWDLSADGKWAVFSRDDPVFAVQETGTTRATDIVRAPGSNLGRLRISPDDRWMAFNKRSGGSIRLYILPFETTALIPEDRWIPITPEETLVNAPQWSAAGEAIYYFSNRDGHFCVWRQTIDRATGRPTGEPVGVWHVHDARLSMSRMPLPSRGMAVSRDAIVISIAENAGNIWMSR